MESVNHGEFSNRKARRRKGRCNPKLCAIIETDIPKDCFVVDMGSGAYGPYVQWMRKNGWSNVWGIDASLNSKELSNGIVKVGDLTRGSICLELFGIFACWIICNEVGEHIPNEHSASLFYNFIGAKGVLLSWAIPGQRGCHHVNCRIPEWVACKMGQIGFHLDEEKTILARKKINNRKVMVFNRGIE